MCRKREKSLHSPRGATCRLLAGVAVLVIFEPPRGNSRIVGNSELTITSTSERPGTAHSRRRCTTDLISGISSKLERLSVGARVRQSKLQRTHIAAFILPPAILRSLYRYSGIRGTHCCSALSQFCSRDRNRDSRTPKQHHPSM